LRKPINVKPKDWVRMMYCVKHLMKLHPEYNEMIMPFYSKMYDLHPYNEDDPFDLEPRPRTSIEQNLDELANLAKLNKKERDEIDKDSNKGLDEMIWDLGLNLPSWEDDDKESK